MLLQCIHETADMRNSSTMMRVCSDPAVVKVVLEIFAGVYAPAKILQTNGVRTVWLRYAEWLLTCPVSAFSLVIHINDDAIAGYNHRAVHTLCLGMQVAGLTDL